VKHPVTPFSIPEITGCSKTLEPYADCGFPIHREFSASAEYPLFEPFTTPSGSI